MSTRVPLIWRSAAEPEGAWSLLLRMRCVMWDGSKQRWDARAEGRAHYGHGRTPEEAMRAALQPPAPPAEPITTKPKRTPLL